MWSWWTTSLTPARPRHISWTCSGINEPESVALCCLLDKPSRRTEEVNIDYRGLTIPNKFIVGYGLDLDQRYRNLPDIYTVETS